MKIHLSILSCLMVTAFTAPVDATLFKENGHEETNFSKKQAVYNSSNEDVRNAARNGVVTLGPNVWHNTNPPQGLKRIAENTQLNQDLDQVPGADNYRIYRGPRKPGPGNPLEAITSHLTVRVNGINGAFHVYNGTKNPDNRNFTSH